MEFKTLNDNKKQISAQTLAARKGNGIAIVSKIPLKKSF